MSDVKSAETMQSTHARANSDFGLQIASFHILIEFIFAMCT